MGYDLGTIEDALLNRIREQLPYLAEVDTYAGQIEMLEEELSIRGVRFPAVLAFLKEDAGQPESKTDYTMTYVFRLLVICQNLRGEQAARREDGGVYQIIGDLKTALIDQKLGLAIQPIEYQKTESLSIRRNQMIYGSDYAVVCSWP